MSFEASLKYYGVDATPYFYSVCERFDINPHVLFLTCMYVGRHSPVNIRTLKQRIWAKVWTKVNNIQAVNKCMDAAIQTDIFEIDEYNQISPGQNFSICIG